MANNISIFDSGANVVVVATIDVSSVHFQHVCSQGDIEHDAVDSGYPVKIGGKASTTAPAAVANADRVNAWFDLNGRQIIAGDTAAAGLCKAEDAAHASGDVGVAVWAVRQDTAAALATTSGDYAPFEVDATGRLWVNTELPDAAALSDTTANPTTPMVGAAMMGWNGSSFTRMPGTTAGFCVVGSAAHDATAAGNPVLLGAEALSADRTAVATTDVTKLMASLTGKLVVLPGAIPENIVSGVTAAITDTSDTQVIASAGASTRNYITSLTITNSHATVGTVVELKDGATVIWRGFAPSLTNNSPPIVVNFSPPLRGSAATAVNAACVTTGSNVYVSASGYKGV